MRTSSARTWLVTGASGFLGRHLVRDLLDRGDRVRALVRATPSAPLEPAAELWFGDVLAEETLDAAVEGVDGVFHLAGRVTREGERDALYALHVDGTANVLRAMKRTGVKRMVLASTSGTVAVSRQPEVFDDDAPYATSIVERWPYYDSKVWAEQVAERIAEQHGIALVTLRPSLLLGPDDVGRSSTDDIRRFLHGEYPVVPKGGACFLDVRDCATTFANAMHVGEPGARYLLGGANMTLRDLFTLVAHVADVEPPVLELPGRLWNAGVEGVQWAARLGWVERPDRIAMEMAKHYWYCDWSRAVVDLGHRPRNPTETIEDTVAWLRADDAEAERIAEEKVLRLPWRLRRREEG